MEFDKITFTKILTQKSGLGLTSHLNIKKPFYQLQFVEKTQFLPEGDMEFVKSLLVLPFPA